MIVMTEPATSDTEKPQQPKPVKTGVADKLKEIDGRGGLDPTRYGDWEIGGKCVDF